MTKTKQQTIEQAIALYLAQQAVSISEEQAENDPDSPELSLDGIQQLAFLLLEEFEQKISGELDRLKLKDIPSQATTLTLKVEQS